MPSLSPLPRIRAAARRSTRPGRSITTLLSHSALSPQPIPIPGHHSLSSLRSLATTASGPTLPPDPSPARSTAPLNFFVTPLFLQLLSGALFLFVGFGLHATLNPPPLETALKPSLIAKAEQSARQPQYGSKEDYRKAIEELQKLWKKKGKENRVSVDEADLESHGISDWSYHPEKRPTVVVWAEDTKEVQEIVIVAQRYKVPITPFSGGTSLEGHFSSVGLPFLLPDDESNLR